jgi:hypothetical protein
VRVLVLYWHPKGEEMRLAVRHHLELFEGRGAQLLYHNAIEAAPPWIAWTAPDLCVLHTTFLSARWNYDFEDYRSRFRWIARLHCPKVALPQDEYDHAAVLDEWLLELGVTGVYSCFGPEQRAPLYPLLAGRAAFRETLTGFIDEDAASAVATRLVPHARRPRDIVYRARNLPYWFGSHGQLKHRIAGVVQERADELGLATDISTRAEDTIYGDDWFDFLMSGRAVIGCESGSSVLDARGEVQRRVRQLLAEQPDLTFEEVDARMASGWDSYAFFAISPRHLEAVITKTAQVLVEGRYSGVLEPERHFIPLRRDFSNLDEALERLRDADEVEAMAERAYAEVYLSGRNNLGVLAEQLLAEARPRTGGFALPFAAARRPSLPIRSPAAGKPLRALVPHLVTFAAAVARRPEARQLVLRRRDVPLREAVKDVVMLGVLARSWQTWGLSAETADGTLVVRTEPDAREVAAPQLDGFERLVWNHSAVAQAAPVFPRHPSWGWISLGENGRYEFRAVAELARADAAAARSLVERTLAVTMAAAHERPAKRGPRQ